MDGGSESDGLPTLDNFPHKHNNNLSSDQGAGDGGSNKSLDSSNESTPRRCASAAAKVKDKNKMDLSFVDMKSSWDGSCSSSKAGMLADPAKIAKEREREERVRQARERLAEERRKKLEDLKEQQRIAQENRERQLEMRRKKIEDLRRRDVERRAAVEERRRIKEEQERIRRESILQKSEERVARYEAWKAGGRKGMFGGNGSPSKQLSMSTSVLYHKRSPDHSSFSHLVPPTRPESAMDRSKSRPSRRDDKSQGDSGDNTDSSRDRKSRTNTSFFDRLSTPKARTTPDAKEPATTTRKDTPAIRKLIQKEKPTIEKEASPKVNIAKTSRAVSKERRSAAATEMSRMTPPPVSSPRGGSPVPNSVGTNKHEKSQHVAAEKIEKSQTVPASEDGTTSSSSQKDITAEEYKAKLAEKRRQAREKAEKEAEEERKRQEEERLAEEQRQREEEEEQRRQEEESLRLAEEARKAEQERLERAIEAEEKRKREEAERLEQERLAKEEADRKMREEQERLEKEKQEKAKREEEERMERKKKLEMIMKRVKPDSNSENSPKSVTSSPSRNSATTGSSPASISPEEHEKPVVPLEQPATEPAVESSESAAAASSVENLEETEEVTVDDNLLDTPASSVVRSASSGDILDNSSHDVIETNTSTPSKPVNEIVENSPSDSKPKFKSPLLQQLVENKSGETSTGSRFKSPLLQNLLGKTKVGARMGLSSSMGDLSQNQATTVASTLSSPGESGSSKEISKQGLDEDKDEDTSERISSSSASPSHSPSRDPQVSQSFTSGHLTNGVDDGSGSQGLDNKSASLMGDSALGSSIEPMSGSVFTNGHSGQHLDTQGSSVTVPGESGEGEGQFEEIIDLLDTPNNKSSALASGSPIIAFDENRRPDVTESLS